MNQKTCAAFHHSDLCQLPHQGQHDHPMLAQCWATVYDGGPIIGPALRELFAFVSSVTDKIGIVDRERQPEKHENRHIHRITLNIDVSQNKYKICRASGFMTANKCLEWAALYCCILFVPLSVQLQSSNLAILDRQVN